MPEKRSVLLAASTCAVLMLMVYYHAMFLHAHRSGPLTRVIIHAHSSSPTPTLNTSTYKTVIPIPRPMQQTEGDSDRKDRIECRHLSGSIDTTIPKCPFRPLSSYSDAYLHGRWHPITACTINPHDSNATDITNLSEIMFNPISYAYGMNASSLPKMIHGQLGVYLVFNPHHPQKSRIAAFQSPLDEHMFRLRQLLYSYRPSKCFLPAFNASHFRHILETRLSMDASASGGGGKVVLVGDSLMQQVFTSWMYLLRPQHRWDMYPTLVSYKSWTVVHPLSLEPIGIGFINTSTTTYVTNGTSSSKGGGTTGVKWCICMADAFDRHHASHRTHPTESTPITYEWTEREFNECRHWKHHSISLRSLLAICPRPWQRLTNGLPDFGDVRVLDWVLGLDQLQLEHEKSVGWLVFSVGHHFYKVHKYFMEHASKDQMTGVLRYLNKTSPRSVSVEELYNVMADRMVRWLEYRLETDLPHLKIIYVLSPPGTPRCQSSTDPLPYPISSILKSYAALPDPFSWFTTYRMQYAFKRKLQSSRILRRRSWWVDTGMLMQRPDGRFRGEKEDCLHWAQPGAMDVAIQILYGIFAEYYGDEVEVGV